MHSVPPLTEGDAYTTRVRCGVSQKRARCAGYHILASDGEIGHLEGTSVDENEDQALRYPRGWDTRNWIRRPVGSQSVRRSSDRFAEKKMSRDRNAEASR